MGASISWNDKEASLNKSAEIFDEFMYDNTNETIIDTITEIKKLVKSLNDECDNLNIYLSRLSSSYGTVTAYDSTIDGIKREVSNSMNSLETKYRKLMNDFALALMELTTKDADLFDDLQKISSSLFRR